MKKLMIVALLGMIPSSMMAQANNHPAPGNDGNKYVAYEQRTGNESVVYFTRSLSAEGLIKAYEQVNENICGHVGVKLHTGEPKGPNIIPREWVKALMAKDLPQANIIETNTYYEGDRYTTDKHRKTLEVNGWTFCPVDILDEQGTTTLPVAGGKWFKKMSVGGHLTNYDSMVALTHFKGHTQGGFGGSNKNIGIGCADGDRRRSVVGIVLVGVYPITVGIVFQNFQIYFRKNIQKNIEKKYFFYFFHFSSSTFLLVNLS
jgi:uncharacterized Fe-S center protein